MSDEKHLFKQLSQTGKSDENQDKLVDHAIHIHDEKLANTWKSCCLLTDKRAIKYFSQLVLISSVMLFSILQLNKDSSCDSTSTYIPLLTMCIGLLCPSPKFQ